jgi:hypothetical protein
MEEPEHHGQISQTVRGVQFHISNLVLLLYFFKGYFMISTETKMPFSFSQYAKFGEISSNIQNFASKMASVFAKIINFFCKKQLLFQSAVRICFCLTHTVRISSQKHIFFTKIQKLFFSQFCSGFYHMESEIWIRIGIKTMPIRNIGHARSENSEGTGRARLKTEDNCGRGQGTLNG